VYSLAALMVLSAVIILWQWVENPAVVNKDIFKVGNQDIDRVELRTTHDTVTLKYDGVRWRVNNRYDAESRLITVLFATLAQAEAKRKMPESLQDSLRNHLMLKGVLVDLFEGEKKIISFYAGGDAQKSVAYFMDDKGNPYLVAIPGYRVYVSGIFELDENGWKEKRIFNFNWRNFKGLSARIDGQQDFVVQPGDEGFEVAGISPVDTTRMNNYLDAVSLLRAEQFISRGFSARYDSLLHTRPALVIEITDLGNRAYHLRLYAPLPGDRYVLGKTGDQEMVLFERQVIDPILKGRNYFRVTAP